MTSNSCGQTRRICSLCAQVTALNQSIRRRNDRIIRPPVPAPLSSSYLIVLKKIHFIASHSVLFFVVFCIILEEVVIEVIFKIVFEIFQIIRCEESVYTIRNRCDCRYNTDNSENPKNTCFFLLFLFFSV